ncbi:hypothetical protein LTR53_009142 [Teratosphaeriaceae sp. CCFEE 6253]|nr:hypothetical protein LTR53_009142 [Teratosphaeriaceae sp. CCFEE 6253]
MAQPGKQPKAMSSRLATMKFMQRAGASPSSSPSTPTEPSSKRQRMSNGSYNAASPPTPQTASGSLASEERKHADAPDRGETKWYLSVRQTESPAPDPPMQIVSAGYSTLDASIQTRERLSGEGEVEFTRPSVAGRRSFGNFNKIVKKQPNPDDDISSGSEEDDDDDDDDESDDPTGVKALIAQSRKEAGDEARAARNLKKQSNKAEALRLAEDRRKKHVNLNNLTSISNSNGSAQSSAADKACHRCGEKGHLSYACPQKGREQQRRGRGER